MSLKLSFFQSNDPNPYNNLARELYLYETCQSDEVIFYLWQNEPTVVIGKNQSANAQCELKKMEQDKVHLARRITGGGAVYHDLGNLNFTFVVPNNLYDQDKQTRVIIDALQLSGIKAEVSGRNDLEVEGRKFSGNAYYHGKDISFQHGTLLLNSDLNKLASYLKVNNEKIAKHRVNSVVSRVVNLKQIKPELTLKELEDNLVRSFRQTYNGKYSKKDFPEEALKKAKMYQNPEWLFRKECEHNFELKGNYTWGNILIQLQADKQLITSATIYSDALDPEAFNKLEAYLIRKPLPLNLKQVEFYIPILYRTDVIELLGRI